MRLAWLALGLAVAFSRKPAAAAPTSEDCRELEGIGCFYAPPEALGGGAIDLLVYFRGLWGANGSSPSELLKSSRQAAERFRLLEVARSKRLVVLATGRYDAAVTREALETITAALARPNAPPAYIRRVYLAAHSAGNKGLFKSLAAFGRVERILMLDDFYFTDNEEESRAKAAALREKTSACVGFYSPQYGSKYRYYRSGAQKFARDANCALDELSSLSDAHNRGVELCLETYLSGSHCDAGGR